MGVSPKWVKSRRRREKEKLNDGNNNGQATHGARKHAWRTQAAWAKKLKLNYIPVKGTKLGHFYMPISTQVSSCVIHGGS